MQPLEAINTELINDNNQSKVEHNDNSKSGKSTKNYKLKDETVHKLVDHFVGTIAFECGYQAAHQSSLDLLNDVCCDYIKKIATQLKFSFETEDVRDNETDFVDSLERVFHQINIPSVANLHQFLRRLEAIKKHQHKECEQAAMQHQAQSEFFSQQISCAPN